MWFLQSRLYYERSCYGKRVKDPDEEDIKEYLSGNLCRCSGYMPSWGCKKYLDMKQSGKEA